MSGLGNSVPRSAAPGQDELEDLWRTYYASTFNPARVSIAAMRKEMPLKHWATLPETEITSVVALPSCESYDPWRAASHQICACPSSAAVAWAAGSLIAAGRLQGRAADRHRRDLAELLDGIAEHCQALVSTTHDSGSAPRALP